MLITLLAGAERRTIEANANETVPAFRKLVAQQLEIPIDSFRLIALGKVLQDKCADGTTATLFVTYRVKNNSSVIVHQRNHDKDQFEQLPEHLASAKKSIVNDSEASTSTASTPSNSDATESILYDCKTCLNNPKIRLCKECGCIKCLSKHGNPLICDQCQEYWHIECANLDAVPEDDYWYCPDCLNTDSNTVIDSKMPVDIRNTKDAKRPSATQKKKWGGGVSCSAREKECIIVPKTHVGPIPGIYCGQSWQYRLTCSEWGVHRMSVGGIAGSSTTGAVSVVMSKGYEDDLDNGNEFYYTGSGGRDLTGNKRLAEHSCDQELSRFNLALAKTCAAPVDEVNGAEAKDWRKSRPIRVCRTHQLACHHPKYAPTTGVRYDGIYKIVKYWPEKGRSGYGVWRFLFRRDDREPAPWTKEGMALIRKRGLRLITQDQQSIEKLVQYKIPSNLLKLMNADMADKRLWDELKTMEFWSEYEFLHHVFANLVVCASGACPAPIRDPITPPCGHICCKRCMQQNNAKTCFTCRADVSNSKVNDKLVAVLKACNPAYGVDTNIALPSETKSTKCDAKLKSREESAPADSSTGSSSKRRSNVAVAFYAAAALSIFSV
ncbi:E3 ubiquitin-protein ligase uhrf1 [Apophysomyces ossiformis]|uniref:RING-type E3 ubiquitin transferase n=1 Tax=Apophysomyces ossiformis TaxID=679940 RepID=A0A8H7BT53_9FUNG|nr:E3 ubiquitin-protein ligase uhrf1 [Apophysomyces ossiformis]